MQSADCTCARYFIFTFHELAAGLMFVFYKYSTLQINSSEFLFQAKCIKYNARSPIYNIESTRFYTAVMEANYENVKGLGMAS